MGSGEDDAAHREIEAAFGPVPPMSVSFFGEESFYLYAILEVGDRVDADDHITSIDDRSEILVEFAVPEDQSSRIAVGTPLTRLPASSSTSSSFSDLMSSSLPPVLL